MAIVRCNPVRDILGLQEMNMLLGDFFGVDKHGRKRGSFAGLPSRYRRTGRRL